MDQDKPDQTQPNSTAFQRWSHGHLGIHSTHPPGCNENLTRKEETALCPEKPAFCTYAPVELVSVSELAGETSSQYTRLVEVSNRRCTSPKLANGFLYALQADKCTRHRLTLSGARKCLF